MTVELTFDDLLQGSCNVAIVGFRLVAHVDAVGRAGNDQFSSEM